ncbi:MAG: type I pullulanase [Ginsengibacter sp.]
MEAFENNFNDYPVYKGNDLGIDYSPLRTKFKVWAPVATTVKLRLFKDGSETGAFEILDLNKDESGTWSITVSRDLKNVYYTFQMLNNGHWSLECPDIYAKAVGVNGHRGMIADMRSTDPEGWHQDKKPILQSFTDIVLYEVHVRDISVDANSGIIHKKLFLGMSEVGTKSKEGESTGLDHFKELGVTYIHLLPSFDFNSVDENKPELNQYNWGYDPQNYNVPEGSYSSNPHDGNARIKEFKKLIQTMHKNGLRVILDVVYNHTSDIDHANFTQFAPGYFYRQKPDGNYSDGTGCGNETASDREMMRSFMISSAEYWCKEYHIDGFRFDLMGIHDIATMNAISDHVHKIDPTIFIYGEGWTAGQTPLPENDRAVKANTSHLKNIAVFNDDLRDGLKGGFSDEKSKAFVGGVPGFAESIKFGIVAATYHQDIHYDAVNYSKAPWSPQPYQTINYVSCHDDNTLFDKLKVSNPDASEEQLIKMDLLSNTIILTSQGVPFLHAGVDFLRTKQGVSNSYKSPDNINEMDWSRKHKYKSVFNYYKGLIALRKNHPSFRMSDTKMIQDHLHFMHNDDPVIVSYTLDGVACGDSWKNIFVAFNGNTESRSIHIPEGNWMIAQKGNYIFEKEFQKMEGGSHQIDGTSSLILFQQ